MFVQAAKRTPVDLREWAVGLMERDNRKSHLGPQPSPSTQDFLRPNDSPPTQSQTDDRLLHTPTSERFLLPAPGLPHLGTNMVAGRLLEMGTQQAAPLYLHTLEWDSVVLLLTPSPRLLITWMLIALLNQLSACLYARRQQARFLWLLREGRHRKTQEEMLEEHMACRRIPALQKDNDAANSMVQAMKREPLI